jgi:hypothetical protein
MEARSDALDEAAGKRYARTGRLALLRAPGGEAATRRNQLGGVANCGSGISRPGHTSHGEPKPVTFINAACNAWPSIGSGHLPM